MPNRQEQIEGNLQITGLLKVLGEIKSPSISKITSAVKAVTTKTTTVIGALGKLIDQAADDNYLTTTEKKSLLNKWEEIKTEYPIIRQGALDDGISESDALIVNFDGGYTALRNHLFVDPGCLSETKNGEEINGAALIAVWEAYYDYRTQLVSARVSLKPNGDTVLLNDGYLGLFSAPPTPTRIGEWYLDSTDGLLYLWTGTVWTTSGITWLHRMAAIEDLFSIAAGAAQIFASMIAANEAFINTAFIQNLIANEAFIENLFAINLNATGGIRVYDGQGVNRRALEIRNSNIDLIDTPEVGAEKRRLRMGRLGVNAPFLISGDIEFSKTIKNRWLDVNPFPVACADICILQRSSGQLIRVFRDTSDNYIYQQVKSNEAEEWGAVILLGSGIPGKPRTLVERKDGTLLLFFSQVSVSKMQWVTYDDGTSSWGTAEFITDPFYFMYHAMERKNGDLLVFAGRVNYTGIDVFRLNGATWEIQSSVEGTSIVCSDSREEAGSLIIAIGPSPVIREYVFDEVSSWTFLRNVTSYTTGMVKYVTLLNDELWYITRRPTDRYLVYGEYDKSTGVWSEKGTLLEVETEEAYFNLQQLLAGSFWVVYLAYGETIQVEQVLQRYSPFATEADVEDVAGHPLTEAAAYTLGDTLFHAFDSIRAVTSSSSYQQMTDEWVATRAGTVKVTFSVTRGSASGTAYGRIYRKRGGSWSGVGSAISCTSSMTPEDSTQSIEVEAGDSLAIFMYTSSTGNLRAAFISAGEWHPGRLIGHLYSVFAVEGATHVGQMAVGQELEFQIGGGPPTLRAPNETGTYYVRGIGNSSVGVFSASNDIGGSGNYCIKRLT